jgi:hypothetical protein
MEPTTGSFESTEVIKKLRERSRNHLYSLTEEPGSMENMT